ncbi:Calx-beta domain-containing protein [Pleomorphomonas sp. PLEO]|uniref:Calx-beta domain-containing protein n=1 Tax=Pleomorphomonas sp. PLEO TaxID=3239306 RepID=UPI00351EB1B9
MVFQPVRRVSGTVRRIQLAIATALLYLLMPVIGAYAAPSVYCTTQTATVNQGGSVVFDVTNCDGPSNVGLGSDSSHPAHGTSSLSGQLDGAGTERVTYTHNGDTATSDSFYFFDEDGDTITFNITINPATSASIAVSPASRNEDSGAAFTYTVTLSQTNASSTTVNLTRSGTATSGTDYTGAVSSVVVAANTSTATFAVTPVADATVEADETVTMSVASGSGYSIGSPSSATATILNDDVPTATIAVSPSSVAEDGATNLVYTVTLDQTPTSATSVGFSVGGGATSGVDYAAVSSPLVIAAGQTSGTITINPTADGTVEADETVALTLAAGSGYSVGSPSSATGTILNDDQPSLSINDVSLSEGDAGTSSATFTVSLSQPAGAGGVSFDIATADGTATGGVDYVASSLTGQTIAAGSSSATFTVQVNGDTLNEPNETFFVNVSNVSGASVADAQGQGTIVNDDGQPTLSIDDVSVNEGNSGTTTATFTVSLSAASGQTVSVNYASADGTATAGSDYVARSGTLTFAPGTTAQGVAVTINGDTAIEPSETFSVNLSGASNATIAQATGTGTILNDDGQPSLSINDVSLSEGNAGTSAFTFTVSLSQPAGAGGVSFDIATADGTATAGVDYVAASQAGQTIAAGASSATFTVQVSGDTLNEPNETFFANVTNVSGASVADAQGQGTIVNDDGSPTLSIDDVSVNEGNSGTTTATFTVSLSSASGQTVSVGYASADGTAVAGSDYVAVSGTLTFAPGTTTKTFTVAIVGDTTVEPDEAFSVNLSGASNATIARATGTGTVSNDDAAVTVTVTVAPATLPSATVGSAYSQTLSASGGTAPYSFAITSGTLPSGLSLSGAGVLSGTPTASGNSSFTVTATDSAGSPVSGGRAYTLTISAAPASFVFTPSGGALPEAMVGEDYSQAISASGGSGSLLYSLASGTLPDGLVLNVSTGALTGPLAASATVGDYSFTLQVTDGNSATATASFTLKVKARAVAVTDKVVNVPAGDAPLNVDLTQGATGGPFITSDLVSVSPPNAGTVSIVNGEFAQVGPVGTLGWYLKFIPNPTYKGQVTVSYRLTSALGVSNLGVVVYNVAYEPGEVAEDIDTLVHGFVQTRQNLIATTVAVPGLLDRRQMAEARSPITGRMSPGDTGLTTTFATSLTQLQAAKAHADGVEAGSSDFNAWVNGTFMLHDRDENGGNWGSFGMLSAGADYLLTEHALIGLSLHYDRMVDPTEEDGELTGNGWLAGPYGSFEMADGIYWDTSLLYGGSSNTIDASFWDGEFETSRYMLDTALKGELAFAEGKLSPKLRVVYFSEQVKDYSVDNADGDVMELKGFTTDQLRISVGADYSRQIKLDDGGILTPRVGATAGFSGLDGSGAFGTITAGIAYSPTDAWDLDLGLLVGVEGDGQTSTGAKVGVTGKF